MACAKKCDRCGKLYEQYNSKNDRKNPNGIMVLNLDSQRRYFTHNALDLCPDCMKGFQGWFGEVKQMERLTYSGTREANNAATIREIINKLCDYENAEEQGLLVRLPCKVGDDVYIIPSPSVYGLNIINGYENLNRVYHQHVGSITFADSHWYATSREEYKVYSEKVLNDIAFGITWFTDREEAEKKLEEMRE